MEWMILPIRRYADFSGRSRRLEYWMFQLFQWIVILAIILMTSLAVSISGGDEPALYSIIAGVSLVLIFFLVMLIPNLAVTWRRMQDQDIDGWVGLLLFFGTIFFSPVGIALMIFMCLDGKPHSNRFGPDPKGRGDSDVRDIFA